MSQETQHLYELLGKDKFREIVFEGLDRLVSALEEKAFLTEHALDDDQYMRKTSDGKLLC
jgi:hypothetical protein